MQPIHVRMQPVTVAGKLAQGGDLLSLMDAKDKAEKERYHEFSRSPRRGLTPEGEVWYYDCKNCSRSVMLLATIKHDDDLKIVPNVSGSAMARPCDRGGADA